jgi:hypothetical protein
MRSSIISKLPRASWLSDLKSRLDGLCCLEFLFGGLEAYVNDFIRIARD